MRGVGLAGTAAGVDVDAGAQAAISVTNKNKGIVRFSCFIWTSLFIEFEMVEVILLATYSWLPDKLRWQPNLDRLALLVRKVACLSAPRWS